MEKTYGILAGYGAPAGLHLHEEIIAQTLHKHGFNDLAFPRFIITNLPYSVMTETGEIQDETEFLLANQNAAEAFAPATDILVLCNSFHRYFPLMETIHGKKLINLPQKVSEEVAASGARNPLLVSSIETINSGLYENDNYNLLTHYDPHLIASGMKTEEPKTEFLYAIIHEAMKEHADAIIMGCTDLNKYAKKIRTMTSLPVFDSVETAAALIVEGK